MGAGAKTTIIQAGTTTSNGLDRLFHVTSGAAVVNISGVTLRHGRSTGGFFTSTGGAIFNVGTLTLNNVWITNNSAAGTGGAIYNFQNGRVDVDNSTISNNTTAGDSGAIQVDSAGGGNTARLNLINSTIAYNTASGSSAILMAINGGNPPVVNVANTIIAYNISANTGGINNQAGTLNATNSIFLGNSGAECFTTAATFAGVLADDASCAGAANPATAISTVLADNGGPVPTLALLNGSNAVEAGAGGCIDPLTALPIATDARGYDRVASMACDIGPFEAGNIFVVTNSSDSGAGSLRQALTDSNATANIGTSPNQIQFAIGSGAQLIALASSLPALTQPVIVDGWSQPGFNGAPLIEINGNGAGEVFRVSGGGSIIRGFVLNNYVGSGINLTSDGNIVIGNYAGTNAAGTTSGPGVGTYGIAVGSSNNQIGGLSAQDRNVIGHNYFAGIIVDAVGPISNNRIVNNHIGVNAAGTAAIPNGGGQAYAGVILGLSNAGVSGTVIGGNDPSLRNVIAGNNGDGIAAVVAAPAALSSRATSSAWARMV